jgi:hypothetical protein
MRDLQNAVTDFFIEDYLSVLGDTNQHFVELQLAGARRAHDAPLSQ